MKTAIVVLGLVPFVSGIAIAMQASPGAAQLSYPSAGNRSSLSIPSSYPESQLGIKSQYSQPFYGVESGVPAPTVIFDQAAPTLEDLSQPEFSPDDPSRFYSEGVVGDSFYRGNTNRSVIYPGVLAPNSSLIPSTVAPSYPVPSVEPFNQPAPQVNSSQAQFSRITIVGSSQPGVGRLDGQLLQATCNQNWGQALQVVDQALRSAPSNSSTYRTTLQAYRDRLQSLSSRQTFVPNWQQQCKGS
ncbi:MAG: hypothetical protein KME43_21630 [Myxacorys chilensis ATA2-1-KO14]|nr:hypothetical protein [Myxacorys chilensis ATA2-1-KO14]